MTKIGVSIVGLGYWGPKLLRNLRNHPDVDVRFLYDSEKHRAEKLIEGSEAVAGCLSDIFDDEDSAAVVIATPPSTHLKLALAALESGKHVLVEKPLARTVQEADFLVNAARIANKILMVGHTYLFNPAIREIRSRLRNMEIGELKYMTALRTNLGPIRTDVGATFDLASHDVAIIAYLLDAFPSHVSATGGSWLTRDIHDAIFASLMFSDGRIARIEASWLHPQKQRQIVLVGDNGMLTFDDLNTDRPVEIFDKQVITGQKSEDIPVLPPTFRVGDIRSPFIASQEPLSVEINAFVSAIASGQDVVSGVSFGRDVTAVLQSIEESIRKSGTPVEVHYAT